MNKRIWCILFMYACMCVGIYICKHIYTFTGTYIHMEVYKYVSIYMYKYVYMYATQVALNSSKVNVQLLILQLDKN